MKKTVSTILVIIVGVLAFALGYITEVNRAKDKENKVDTTEEKEDVNPSKEVASYEEVAPLVSAINNVYIYYSYEYIKGFDKMDTNYIMLNAIRNAYEPNKTTFTASEVKDYIKKYFGENYKYEDKDIICMVDKNPLYSYDKDQKVYSPVTEGHGHDGGAGYQYPRGARVYVENVSKESDEITIQTRIAYEGTCGGTCGPSNAYYKTPGDFENVVYGDKSANQEVYLSDSELEKIKDKLSLTTFTFSKNKDGSYYLSNVTVKD